jgi:hypothetical protein
MGYLLESFRAAWYSLVILSAAKDLMLTLPVVSMRSFAALRMT